MQTGAGVRMVRRGHIDDPLFVTRRLTRFRCPRCGCDTFLDALEFAHNPKLLYWSPFRWGYKGKVEEKGLQVRAHIEVPYFHFFQQKIRYRDLSIATLKLDSKGELNLQIANDTILKRKILPPRGKIREIKGEIESQLPAALLHLFDNEPRELKWLRDDPGYQRLDSKRKLEALQRFLRHRNLREFGFFYWHDLDAWGEELKGVSTVEAALLTLIGHRREKSVRRALFSSYEAAVALGGYDPLADHLFASLFEDPNYLSSLLGMDPERKRRVFEGLTRMEAEELAHWLRLHFDPQRLHRLFETFRRERLPWQLLRDSYMMLRTPALRDYFREFPAHLPANPRQLHDRLAEIHHRYGHSIQTVTFDYSKPDLAAQGIRKGLEFRLPQTTYELERWSKELSNCMFSYREKIAVGQSLIYGVFKDEKLLYAVEIVSYQISQALGRYNRPIPDADLQIIRQWQTHVWMKGWLEYREKIYGPTGLSRPSRLNRRFYER